MKRLFANLLLAASASPGATHAADDPELKTGIVTESRVYERAESSIAVTGVRTAALTEWVSRVTVAVDGERITGEWVPKTTISATAKDFPRGRDVRFAVRRNRLLLEHSDGSIVTARIVRRVAQQPDDERARN